MEIDFENSRKDAKCAKSVNKIEKMNRISYLRKTGFTRLLMIYMIRKKVWKF
jgi:hypothetical protein